MPLIEESTLVRELLRPADSAGEPPLQRMSRALAEGAQDRAHHVPGGSRPVGSVLGSEMSLHDILSRRRSLRAFSAEPVPAEKLGIIAGAGLAAERRQWPVGAHCGMGMTFVLAALNVAGLPPGFYICTADASNTLSLLQEKPARMQELRQRYADAPAILMVCGDVGSACRAMGKHGYGQILVRAAAAGYAAWLRAISLGMAGTVFGGTCHQVTASLIQAGSPHLWHLFTVAVGIPERCAEGALSP
jgi:hypothetical protein